MRKRGALSDAKEIRIEMVSVMCLMKSRIFDLSIFRFLSNAGSTAILPGINQKITVV